MKKLTIEFIKKEFEKEGYELLDEIYKNVHSKLHCLCPSGHKYNTAWAAWSQGKRCATCHYIRISGSRSYMWKGGIACEPYCDVWIDKDFKESIKERDGYKCLNPDCKKSSKRLSTHHIDYNKKSCKPENLITLCVSCNSRANIDREWHKEWYRAIMHNRYSYVY